MRRLWELSFILFLCFSQNVFGAGTKPEYTFIVKDSDGLAKVAEVTAKKTTLSAELDYLNGYYHATCTLSESTITCICEARNPGIKAVFLGADRCLLYLENHPELDRYYCSGCSPCGVEVTRFDDDNCKTFTRETVASNAYTRAKCVECNLGYTLHKTGAQGDYSTECVVTQPVSCPSPLVKSGCCCVE